VKTGDEGEEAVNYLEDVLARVYRAPHFAIEMYELWASSIHRLMLRALETGKEDRARELYYV